MDQKEYFDNDSVQLEAAIRRGHELVKSQIFTVLPCKVVSYNAQEQSVRVRPLIQQKIRGYDSSGQFTYTDRDMPEFVDLPVQFPSGGGFSMTFPLKPGDEGTMKVSSRCIDNWWLQPSNVQASSNGCFPQAEMRMHDLNDCYFEPGGRSKPRWLQNVSTSSTQLRADDGNTVIDITDGHITLTATTVTIKGQLNVTGAANVGAAVNAGTDVTAGNQTVGGDGAALLAAPGTVTLSWSPTAGGTLTVNTSIPTLVRTVGDIFNISGALNIGGLGGNALVNGAFTVNSFLHSQSFTALLPAALGQIGIIGGNPSLSAIVSLLDHFHHGVQTGPAISQQPVTGT